MAHLDEVIVKVDDTLAEGVITHMNELLIALSDDPQLSREERYTQQQRLRTAIAHHGRQHQEEQDARREQLTKGGAILWRCAQNWRLATSQAPTTSITAPHTGPISARTGTPWARTKSMINPPTSWLATSTAMVVAAPTV